MITGTGPFTATGVASVRSMFTNIEGHRELSTCPHSFLATTGIVPTVSFVTLTTSHVTLGTLAGTRP